MSRDSSRTHLHLHASHHADLFEDFTRFPLAPDNIYLAPNHQPINPEDEDDVVPDQHAAFGINKATRDQREPGWRDLRLFELLATTTGAGPSTGSGAEQSLADSASRVDGRGAAAGAQSGQPVVGPTQGGVGVPVGVRTGMRAVGATNLSALLRQ
ncbi:Apc13p-domain-containing protein [Microthyrium microscopicum]|uniref:Apc13p-domain-containing protein n=1 Tax=Microthyrium microscopicum TaxID=703497 RepID=A0A6A6TW30_9PEZI|nr:Apc13p-domain-containing protein [Microthyrium microscopicum]